MVIPPRFSRIVFTGFMGSGKSTVGRLLAQRIGWQFQDIDATIETSAGEGARTLFARLGEAKFRKLESEILAKSLLCNQSVISTGGAVIDKAENQAILKSSIGSLIIHLDAPFEVLIARCRLQEDAGESTFRPILHNRPLAQERFTTRRDLYSAHAHLTEDVADRSPDEVVQSLLMRIPEIAHIK